jgi:SAM-dependent methyltransferase
MSLATSLATKISVYNRQRKWSLFLEQVHPDRSCSILDAGFEPGDDYSACNFLEKHYPYVEKITALGLRSEQVRQVQRTYPTLKIVEYDGDLFPFKDKEFDLCWSNAVLEHVGAFEKQLLFLKEAKRVAKRLFITTPNRSFPIEVHTLTPLLHWLPKPIFDDYLRVTHREWAMGDYLHLLRLRELKHLLELANIREYRIFKNRLGGFVLDFVIIT